METNVSYDETALGTENNDELPFEITNLPSDDTKINLIFIHSIDRCLGYNTTFCYSIDRYLHRPFVEMNISFLDKTE
jgi:hypothetical protein